MGSTAKEDAEDARWRATAFSRGAAWLLVILPVFIAAHWHADRLSAATVAALAEFIRSVSSPSVKAAPWWASAAAHGVIGVTLLMASLAWLGAAQPLEHVGPPPKHGDDAPDPVDDGVTGVAGSFAARAYGEPERDYCDGADLLDDAERESLDPTRPMVIFGASARAVASERAAALPAPGEAASAIVPLYTRHGLGPGESSAAAALYEDVVRRVVSGVVYQDPSRMAYGASNRLYPTGGFSLAHRAVGADEPRDAMSWVGIRRLRALQRCVAAVLDEGVPGDVLECGVLYGGAAIAAKAVLRARGADAGPGARRVLCADTFVPTAAGDRVPPRERPAAAVAVEWAVVRLVRALALFLPDSALQWATRAADAAMPDGARSFPRMTDEGSLDPSIVRWVRCVMRSAGSPDVPGRRRIGPGVHRVRSHFARLGLLDDGVVFLRGFFSESLADAGWGDAGTHPVLRRLAVLRLDGDTFESTWTALEGAYHRLSPGGFCIIDDYGSFPGCKRAVDEFRAERGISAPLEEIDAHAVQWRKGPREPVEG